MLNGVAVGAEENTFFNFGFDRVPAFIRNVTNNKIFSFWVCVVELESSLVSAPAAVIAFSAQVFYGSGLGAVPSDFCIAGTAPRSPFVLIIFEFVAAYFTNLHIFSITQQALPGHPFVEM